ncbi:major facilitator superfamily transporter [Colletotrichum graminicola M1.001]|uniref:Major facilitator superfamily transporter n=1 Tax=Colletotrichum graminicola (strain M1.001 / M2 / FGSC 10212) TaxID=645133 RepID=E3QSV1_COLGM|nr:major facilitator superfamily transporter [Colletotrichum graminicola M1.001]EFQ33939.1 major facilitator superfamily transporter [Colletotrichum graminicola M1.001]
MARFLSRGSKQTPQPGTLTSSHGPESPPSMTPVTDHPLSEKPPSSATGTDPEASDKPTENGSHGATGDASALATEQGDAEEEEYMTGVKLNLVLAGLTLVVFLMLLDGSIITTAVPEITTAFNSLSDVGWYGAAYSLCGAALQPFAGKLYTYLSSKQTFLAFLFLFELGSLICGVAKSSDMFIVGRAVAGMGTAGLFNGALTIIGTTVPLQKRPLIIGIVVGISNMGLVVGPLIGGAFTQYVNWRWCFYINLPIGGVVAVLLLLIQIPSKIANPLPLLQIPAHLDLPGFVLFAPAAVMFLLALQFGGNDYSWDSSVVIGLFVGAGVTTVLFFYWEHRLGDDEAMMPLDLFKNRIIWTSCVTGAASYSMTMVSSYYLPLYFQSVKGATPFEGGRDFLPTILSQLIFAVLSGALVGRMGYYIPWVVFGSIVATIGNGLISTWTPHTSSAAWIGHQVLLGAGRGSNMQMHIIAVQANSAPSRLPVVMATVIFLQTFGGAIFLTVASVIFSEGLGTNLARYAPSVDARTILAAGGTGFRTVVPQADLPGVLMAYSRSIGEVFYLLVALSGVIFVLAWGMGWVDIRKKDDKKKNNKGEV